MKHRENSRTDTLVRSADSLEPTADSNPGFRAFRISSGMDTHVRDPRTPIPEPRTPLPRPSRAKRNLAWEQIDRESGGYYSENLNKLALRFPTLSPAELRIAALIKAMLPSREIGNRLGIEVRSVERQRVTIRRKLGLSKENLTRFLAGN